MDAATFEKRAKACGAHAYIPKGLMPAQFLEHVARAFAARDARAQGAPR
jgi:hypothetical protein